MRLQVSPIAVTVDVFFNNRAERALRFVVIARASGQYPKNEQGAEAYSAFASVIRTDRLSALTKICDFWPF
jgi:hypothetical protein